MIKNAKEGQMFGHIDGVHRCLRQLREPRSDARFTQSTHTCAEKHYQLTVLFAKETTLSHKDNFLKENTFKYV